MVKPETPDPEPSPYTQVGSTALAGQIIDEGSVDMSVVALVVDNTTVSLPTFHPTPEIRPYI